MDFLAELKEKFSKVILEVVEKDVLTLIGLV